MSLTLAAVNLTAGLLLLVIGGTLIVSLPKPHAWAITAFVLLDVGLLGGGLVMLPFALQMGS